MNSLVTLPIVAAMPVTAPAMPAEAIKVDPAFAAIEAHKKARSCVRKANAEVTRLYEIADLEVGPGISVLDMRESSERPGWHPYVTASAAFDIDNYVPFETDPDLNRHYRSIFKDWSASRNKILGDLDAIVSDEMCDALHAAESDLTEVVPNSVPGLLALLCYLQKAHKEYEPFSGEEYGTLFGSLAKSAKLLMRQPRENLVLTHVSMSAWPEWLPDSLDAEICAASVQLQINDLAIEGLQQKFGDDADSRDDYRQISDDRFEILDLLASTPSESWRGVKAKASALRLPDTLGDYDATTAIAESLADDIVIRCCEPPASVSA